MALTLEKKVLYATTFCKYREKLPYKIRCTHPLGYGICDLDLCPLIQPIYANVIFQEDGIYLVIKRPSKSKVAGEISKIKLDINVEEDNEAETIEFIKGEVEGIPDKIFKALVERIHRIYERFRFLKSKGEKIPGIEKKIKEREEEELAEEVEFETEEEFEEGVE